MLLGIWENIEHLEQTMSLEELNKVIEAGRERDMRHWRFQASLKGIKLDDDAEDDTPQETGEEALERIKRRAALKAQGITDEATVSRQVDRQEILDVGLDFVEG